MRRIALTTAAFILAVAEPSFAQGFIQYNSRTETFQASNPGREKVEIVIQPKAGNQAKP